MVELNAEKEGFIVGITAGVIIGIGFGFILFCLTHRDTRIEGSGHHGGGEFGAKEWPNGGSLGGYLDVYCEHRDQPISMARVNANVVRMWCGKMPYLSKPTDDWDAGEER